MRILATFIKILFEIWGFAIIVRILLSWIGTKAHGGFTRIVHETTEPVLALARKLLPPMGGFDFSPILAIVGLDMLKNILLYIFGG